MAEGRQSHGSRLVNCGFMLDVFTYLQKVVCCKTKKILFTRKAYGFCLLIPSFSIFSKKVRTPPDRPPPPGAPYLLGDELTWAETDEQVQGYELQARSEFIIFAVKTTFHFRLLWCRRAGNATYNGGDGGWRTVYSDRANRWPVSTAALAGLEVPGGDEDEGDSSSSSEEEDDEDDEELFLFRVRAKNKFGPVRSIG